MKASDSSAQQWIITGCLAWVPFAIGLSFIIVARSLSSLFSSFRKHHLKDINVNTHTRHPKYPPAPDRG